MINLMQYFETSVSVEAATTHLESLQSWDTLPIENFICYLLIISTKTLYKLGILSFTF